MKNIFDFVPKTSIPYIEKLLIDKKIIFLLKNKRKTKHGDFRITKDKKTLITLNKTKIHILRFKGHEQIVNANYRSF